MATANTTAIDLPLFIRGKVRDVYDLGNELLLVASDRISAFDYVLGSEIPEKGRVLTQVSRFWFGKTQHIVKNHLISADVSKFPADLQKYSQALDGRTMLVKKTNKIMIECVVRGYLSGSGWKEYKTTGKVCGIQLPAGLQESQELPEPIFTPATKEEGGKHDENISFEEMKKRVDPQLADRLKEISIALYQFGRDWAKSKKLILADTKFEFGTLEINGKQEIILIDECLTPDSSRFWEVSQYKIGTSPTSFDKQFVRDYLNGIGWNHQPPVPSLPADVISKTQEKYLEAYRLITGENLK